MKNTLLLFLCFVFSASNCYGQLPDFDLQIDVSHETCLGNGKLLIYATNTVAGAQISCFTYKLPDLGIPVSTSSTPTGLSHGNYKVVVTQTLNGVAKTQEKDIIIENKIKKLTYDILYSLSDCLIASIEVNILTGNAAEYEIIEGPKTFPKQISNKFSDLVSGKYRVRVIDDCGDGIVQDYTVPKMPEVPKLEISDKYTVSCDSVKLIDVIKLKSGNKINYPLKLIYTISPANGGQKYNVIKTIDNGPTDALQVDLGLPLFWSYSLGVTDNCGRVFNFGNTLQIFQVLPKDAECDRKFFDLNISSGLSPCTVNFIAAPLKFNPKDFNKSHPGPFFQNSVTYGSTTKPVPEGDYSVKITDACGRTNIINFKIEQGHLKPNAQGFKIDCSLGGIQISLPSPRKIVSVKITKAPAGYTSGLPSDVSYGIDAKGAFMIKNVPIGSYELLVRDECGIEYIVKVEVPGCPPEQEQEQLKGSWYPGCAEGFGSLSIELPGKLLTSVKITGAPTNYGKTLPFDVSSDIINGKLALNDLPVGVYQCSTIDSYGKERSITITIQDYILGYEIIRNCGSFDIKVNDVLPKNESKVTYWLQKINPSTSKWGHPYSGNEYIEGSVPDNSNSLSFEKISYNFNLKGDFRIIMCFTTKIASFPVKTNDCIRVLDEFSFDDDLEIQGVYNLDCKGGPGASTFLINIQGAPPYICKITEKDNLPFVVDNGSNNVFTDLAPGTYNFLIQDKCGRLANGKYTITDLPKLIQANKPNNISLCGDGNSYTFDLTQQTISILGTQDPKKYKVSFYLNSFDAENGTNQILTPSAFVNTTNPQTIFARVIHKYIDICYDSTSFEVFVGKSPVPSITPSKVFCEGSSIILYTDSGYSAYQWSTGATTSSINVSESGTYSVTVKNVYDNLSCDASKDFIVTTAGNTEIDGIEIHDWTDNLNSIEVKVSGKGEYEYSLDNVNFQSENVFSNLETGDYKVFVRDKNACGTITKDVLLLRYPKFFTPNGDGFNENWRIEFSDLEPGLITFIYDRYGKLLSAFKSDSLGWDGTFNGERMPSDDYWFVVERANHEVHKGHFTMKR